MEGRCIILRQIQSNARAMATSAGVTGAFTELHIRYYEKNR
jgi:hypothetical protein